MNYFSSRKNSIARRCIFITATLACALSSPAEHYRVYLLGGQSNASGRGDAAQLPSSLSSPQTDVRFYWHRTQSTTNVGWLVEDTWINLAPGSGHGRKRPVYAKEFGLEIAFGRAIADAAPSINAAIIKYSAGGSNLHTQWSEKGSLYKTFVSTVQAGLSALENEGHTYELAGMIWQQGENDTRSEEFASAYETNLINLISRVRTDLLEGKKLPFIIGGLSDNQPLGADLVGSPGYILRQAQETVAQDLPQVGFVNTDGYSVRPTDRIHFSKNGQLALGADMATEMLALQALDPDLDGLTNEEEALLGTDPNLADTDLDGQEDGIEIRAGTDPLRN